MKTSLQDVVQSASQCAEVRHAVHALYQDVQFEINQRRPLCVMSGRCCRFEEFGHRLFVTTMELATFLHDLGEMPQSSWDGTGCPFQRGKLCSVHAIRPFGCRMFFCDATSTQWQQEAYERVHSRLKRLHEELHVPYAYMEWREALALMGVARPSRPCSGHGP